MRGVIDRRGLLRAGTLAASVGAMPGAARAAATALPALVVFDSRVPESRAFASGYPLATRHDLALGPLALRARLAALEGGSVAGLTGWADWCALRGAALGAGLRRAEDQRVTAPLSGRRNLFRWTLSRG